VVADHDRHSGRRLRGESDALLHRDLSPGWKTRDSLCRVRLAGRGRTPPLGGLQVGQRGRELDTAPGDSETGDKVEDYCGGQCFYDNVIEVDPVNPDVVYAAASSTTASIRRDLPLG